LARSSSSRYVGIMAAIAATVKGVKTRIRG
jgi:hypothetical protein